MTTVKPATSEQTALYVGFSLGVDVINNNIRFYIFSYKLYVRSDWFKYFNKDSIPYLNNIFALFTWWNLFKK